MSAEAMKFDLVPEDRNGESRGPEKVLTAEEQETRRVKALADLEEHLETTVPKEDGAAEAA